MHNTLAKTLLAAAALAAGSAAAQMHHHGHAGHSEAMAQASGSAMADGEVRKVDKGAGKITLRHGPIASIGMPPISTMGLGRRWVSSEIRVPSPPARMTAFMPALPRAPARRSA